VIGPHGQHAIECGEGFVEPSGSIRIPAMAVRALFDDYSTYYDSAMVGSLDYRAPTHLRDLATG